MKLQRIHLAVFVSLFIILVLAGCGDSSSQSSATALKDSGGTGGTSAQACSIINQSDVEAALGQPFNKSSQRAATGTNGTVCEWETTAQTDLGLPQKGILVMYYPGVDPGTDPARQKTVSGIGDDAYYGSTGLTVLKNNNKLVISYSGAPTPDPAIEELAKRGAAKM